MEIKGFDQSSPPFNTALRWDGLWLSLSQRVTLCQSPPMTQGCGARWRSLTSLTTTQMALSPVCFYLRAFALVRNHSLWGTCPVRGQFLVPRPGFWPSIQTSHWICKPLISSHIVLFLFLRKWSGELKLKTPTDTSPFYLCFFLSLSPVSLKPFVCWVLISDCLSPYSQHPFYTPYSLYLSLHGPPLSCPIWSPYQTRDSRLRSRVSTDFITSRFKTSDKLEREAEINAMKFNWDKCKFLSLVSKIRYRRWSSIGSTANSIKKIKNQ